MRLPRVRFTVRTIMVGVAVVALVIAVEQTRRRRALFHERAEFHSRREYDYGRLVPLAESLARGETFESKDEKGEPAYVCGNIIRGIRESPVRWAYHARLRRKYERANRLPWLTVEPDPPPE